ncbi:unnamed protein product [Adineta steineri]|uniref:Uncharacterized protein n=1 Tax=Adineta steineri TaxID=433720 RepID=A0A814WNA1_9BILA|nr:unnamed protein product [Adineta steineri]CAF1204616.1 unnamed protein product [Adineta steineri]
MSHLPPIYNLSIVSLNPLSGKSCLCKRLIDSNIDNYQLFLSNNNNNSKLLPWFYWGSIKHRRLDEKREAIFHLIEHSSIDIDDNETIENYFKRLTILTLRTDDKKTFPKEKIIIDGFVCIYDLSLNKSISDFLILLHTLLKTRRSIIIVTTKNDLLTNQTVLSQQFEQIIHNSLLNIPIIHTSAHEHVNIQSVLELALYACDEPTKKSFHLKYIPPNYTDAYKTEQSLKHVIQTEYRALLNRHVPDFRIGSWEKFYERWQHHTCVQTFIDMFGKQQAKCLYDEHIEELRKISRQKLIDERLIQIIEMLINDQKTKLSRNWDYVRLQMQKHPHYSSTVIPSSMWSDAERNNTTNSLIIPDDLLDTSEARQRFESYINNRQLEQIRRTNCRTFFDLLTRFSDAGLVHYGDSYDKDCVYFLGRECYESLNGHDRLRVFAIHQSYLYRLLCLQFVELLFESLEIFINTFDKMNLATNVTSENNFNSRKITTVTIDDIFQKEIIQEIKHDSRYQSLNKRETDRHRLIMCHCHFLYDCIYYPSININRLLKQRRRSFKRRKSSSVSLTSNMSIDDNFCPYTRKVYSHNANDENEENLKKKFEIACPMENNCADIRIINEILLKLKFKNMNKNIVICGNDGDIEYYQRIFSSDLSDIPINFLTFNNLKSQTIDGCIFVSSNSQKILRDMNIQRKLHLNIDHIPILNLYSQFNNKSISNDELRSTIEHFLSNDESLNNKIEKSNHIRILLCFMCGSDKNDVEVFFSQLSSRFSLTITNQSSFMINTFFGRSNRKIELIPVSFHSLFAVKLIDFDGFILFYDRDRKAAFNTMMYLEKHISTVLQNELKEKDIDNENTNGTVIVRPPIYILSCVKDSTLANIKKSFNNIPQIDYCIQRHSGTIRNFLESHFLSFLNQCWTCKYGNMLENNHYQYEELLAGVQSYFNNNHFTHSSINDLMTSSLEHTRQPLINSTNNDRIISLTLSSRSNENSPKRHQSLLTPTNHEPIFTYRSFPYLSSSTNGADLTIVPTTPVDPSIPNISLISSSSISTNSMPDNQQQYFQKSTSMRFAKLKEHPTNRNAYQSAITKGSLLTRQKIAEVDEMNFHIHKNRSTANVKVPLATPEIIELNEITTAPYSIQEFDETPSPTLKNSRDDLINSSSSVTHDSIIDESITDSSKQTRVTDSSVDSSSDERLKTSSTTIENIVTLQRKTSDRKSKRVRAKQNDPAGSASSNEILKKLGSDDDVLNREDKRSQKKKRRPSFRRRKKSIYDQTQTDSGIDSRMDSSKVNNTPEPSTSIVISNEDDSSVGDCTKDSKNTSIEELEERPTANWIRRQLQYFAQARREKSELKSRSSALTTVTSVSPPSLFKFTMTSTPSQTQQTTFPLTSLENSYHHVPIRLVLSRCLLSNVLGIPLFIEKCILYIEEHGLSTEGLYRISGYKNQVELVINKLIQDPNYDLNLLQIPASAVATAFKDMMRKLNEPILSLEQFDDCQTLTIDQLREQNFSPLKKALLRTSDLKYRTNKFIFKHLYYVSQHAGLTHMDSSNLAVLWWPNLLQPQFHDLRTAEQICQKAKPLIQTIIDNYSIIFTSDQINEKI